MIQGGGREGKDDASLWGAPFADEFDDRLKHDKVGVLSMANVDKKDTNKQQFFVRNAQQSMALKSQSHVIMTNVISV